MEMHSEEVVFTLQSDSSSNINTLESRKLYLAKLRHIGLVNSIKYNQAKHIQYSGAKLTRYAVNPFRLVRDTWHDLSLLDYSVIKKLESKLLNLQKLAIEKGCCLENYDLFIIRHIFSAKYHTIARNLKMGYTIASFDS